MSRLKIDALQGRLGDAEAKYERAVALARESGATFLEGVASVGLVSARATGGRIDDALAGYRELAEYWERTGGWVQLWATLRNLAALLRDLGDERAASLIEFAADHAPDAPAVHGATDAGADGGPGGCSVPSRGEVLTAVRDAIDRHDGRRRAG